MNIRSSSNRFRIKHCNKLMNWKRSESKTNPSSKWSKTNKILKNVPKSKSNLNNCKNTNTKELPNFNKKTRNFTNSRKRIQFIRNCKRSFLRKKNHMSRRKLNWWKRDLEVRRLILMKLMSIRGGISRWGRKVLKRLKISIWSIVDLYKRTRLFPVKFQDSINQY